MAHTVPCTFNRARLALVQSRTQLRKARSDLRLAITILRQVRDEDGRWPQDHGERVRLLGPLEDILGRLELLEGELVASDVGRSPEVVAGDVA
jgi:hypothetical protein